MKIASSLLSAGVIASLVAACGGSDGGTGPSQLPSEVTVGTSFELPARFIPATVKVATGGTVTFSNTSPAGVIHSVMSDNGAWTLTTISAGESFDVVFPNPGAFTYHCTLHQGMTGLVRVE